MPALSEPELMEFAEVGTLEAFNSDGLRSLIRTMPDIPNMIERTLRYPGHIELMRVLRETGFFSKEAILVKGQAIRPIDLTSQLLFPMWKLEQEEEEFTVMRVIIEEQKTVHIAPIPMTCWIVMMPQRRLPAWHAPLAIPAQGLPAWC